MSEKVGHFSVEEKPVASETPCLYLVCRSHSFTHASHRAVSWSAKGKLHSDLVVTVIGLEWFR